MGKRMILGACLAVVAVVVFACVCNNSTTTSSVEIVDLPSVDLGKNCSAAQLKHKCDSEYRDCIMTANKNPGASRLQEKAMCRHDRKQCNAGKFGCRLVVANVDEIDLGACS